MKDEISQELERHLTKLSDVWSRFFNVSEKIDDYKDFTFRSLTTNCLFCLLPKDDDDFTTTVPSNAGVPYFPDTFKSMHTVKTREITMTNIRDIKYFLAKYGPRDKQAREYFLLKGIKGDDRYEFITKLIEYGFVHRPAISAKSILHREIIKLEDNKKEIEVLGQYY